MSLELDGAGLCGAELLVPAVDKWNFTSPSSMSCLPEAGSNWEVLGNGRLKSIQYWWFGLLKACA